VSRYGAATSAWLAPALQAQQNLEQEKQRQQQYERQEQERQEEERRRQETREQGKREQEALVQGRTLNDSERARKRHTQIDPRNLGLPEFPLFLEKVLSFTKPDHHAIAKVLRDIPFLMRSSAILAPICACPHFDLSHERSAIVTRIYLVPSLYTPLDSD
jgi:hypothetical protein